MTIAVTHRKVTSGTVNDAVEVDLDDWNDTHVVTGAQDSLTVVIPAAVGDGNANDTAALAAAISAAAGKTLWLTPGAIYSTDPVLISSVSGYPREIIANGATFKARASSTSALLTWEHDYRLTTSLNSPAGISGWLILDANSLHANALYIHGADHLKIDGIQAINATSHGVKMLGEENFGIYYNTFDNIYSLTNAVDGFNLNGSLSGANAFMQNNEFGHPTSQNNGGKGFQIDGISGSFVDLDAEANLGIGFNTTNISSPLSVEVLGGFTERNNNARQTAGTNGDTSIVASTAQLRVIGGTHNGTITLPAGAFSIAAGYTATANSVLLNDGTFGLLAGVHLPIPSAATKGGVFSKAAVSHQFLTSISSVDGSIGQAQPAFTDISGSLADGQLSANVPLLAANNSFVNASATPGQRFRFDSADATPLAINNQTLTLSNFNTTNNNYANLMLTSKDNGGTERSGGGVMGIFTHAASMVQTDLIFYTRELGGTVDFPMYLSGKTVAFGSSAGVGVPAIIPSGTTAQFRLADNSADAPITAAAGTFSGALKSSSATGGVGYATGAGGTIAQGTNRTTGVTLNTVSGAITLFSQVNTAISAATAQSFTVTNSVVAATDVILASQKSGTDKYEIFVTAVAGGSFQITNYSTGGTTNEAPVFNFAVIKAVTS